MASLVASLNLIKRIESSCVHRLHLLGKGRNLIKRIESVYKEFTEFDEQHQ